jgi:integrase
MSKKTKAVRSSISYQCKHSLDCIFMEKDEIDEFKAKTGVTSVSKAMRPGGNPTGQRKRITGIRTRNGYFEATRRFFTLARELTGLKLLRDLLKPEIIILTMDTYERDKSPNTNATMLSAINKLYLACLKVGYIEGDPEDLPVTPEVREHVKSFNVFGVPDKPRFGYQSEDALMIVAWLKAQESPFALAAEVVHQAGLRISEVAGLRGDQVDPAGVLHIKGKGGRPRSVRIDKELAERLKTSEQYLFNPNRKWKRQFWQELRKATRALNIETSGVHRLRANFAQDLHAALMKAGASDQAARQTVSEALGHNRTSVTGSYVPFS